MIKINIIIKKNLKLFIKIENIQKTYFLYDY